MIEIERVLFTQDEIKQKVAHLAKLIQKDYEGKNPLIVCILKGSIIFFADLIRQLQLEMEVDTMIVSSYGNSTSSCGNLKIIKDLTLSATGKDVILVEDVIDTGVTMSCLLQHFDKENLNSIKVVSLFDKPCRRKINYKADYIGFEIPDYFIVGYGLDFAEKYRNLPDVCILKSVQ